MIRTIEVEENDNFKTCDKCIHSDDEAEVCRMRGCTHAILDRYIKECYQPKGSEGKRWTLSDGLTTQEKI